MPVQRRYASVLTEDLERIAQSADQATLKEILHELAFRERPRARKLEADIQRRLKALDQGAASGGARRDWSHPARPSVQHQGEFLFGDTPQPPRRRSHAQRLTFAPTEEQAAARDAFMRGGSLKIAAFAGAGKTSTLKLMANERAGRGLYLAFNRKIAMEARGAFPTDTDCRTTHSLAARSMQSLHNFSRDKMFTRIASPQLAAAFGLDSMRVGDSLSLTDVQQAHLFLSTVRRFCQSDADEIDASHLPRTGKLVGLKPSEVQNVEEHVLCNARSLWARMCCSTDPIPLGHDGYLKLWALGKPRLDYEYILLDEAQDTNGVVLGVLALQKCQMVYVGDQHQQIYEWRGAVNAMAKMQTAGVCALTQSFRFGDAIANEATKILARLGETERLRGNPEIKSRIVQGAQTRAILARTNATVIAETLNALNTGRAPFIVGGTQELEAMVKDVFSLKRAEPGSHPDFFGFKDWNEVLAFAGTEEGEDLLPFVTLVQQHGERALYAAIRNSASDESAADVSISTAHKAKGGEWESVHIADDFQSATASGLIAASEGRLFYVAITRAKRQLSVDPALLSAFTDGPSFVSDSDAAAARRQHRRAGHGAPEIGHVHARSEQAQWRDAPLDLREASPRGDDRPFAARATQTSARGAPNSTASSPTVKPKSQGFFERLFRRDAR